MLKTLYYLPRLLKIILVLIVYHRRIDEALERLGPVFIKFGQALSTRADLVGAKTALALSRLQDKLLPFDSKLATDIIEQELGASLDEFFSYFELQPIAAASIAQVHKAVTKDGRHVAVKVRRPGIEKLFAKDIGLFYVLASLLNFISPRFKRLKLKEVIQTFETSTKWEMDFQFEAAAAAEMKDNFAGDTLVYIPEIFWPLISQKVLTMEWVDAISINNRPGLIAAGVNLDKVSAAIAVTFFNQAYRDGFFHADMHAGNIFVNAQGQIVLIDFGIMGRLDQKNRIYIAEILSGFLNRDYNLVAKIHLRAGYVPDHISLDSFAQACRSIGEPIIGQPTNKISIAKLLIQLFKVTEDFEMETQPQLLLLQKTMVMVEGIGVALNPEVNMWQLAEPWIENWAIHNISPEAKLLALIKHLIEKVAAYANSHVEH